MLPWTSDSLTSEFNNHSRAESSSMVLKDTTRISHVINTKTYIANIHNHKILILALVYMYWCDKILDTEWFIKENIFHISRGWKFKIKVSASDKSTSFLSHRVEGRKTHQSWCMCSGDRAVNEREHTTASAFYKGESPFTETKFLDDYMAVTSPQVSTLTCTGPYLDI